MFYHVRKSEMAQHHCAGELLDTVGAAWTCEWEDKGGGGGCKSFHLPHPELLEQSVGFAPVDTDSGHGFTHRAACLVLDPGAPRMDARALGSNAHGTVYRAGARACRGARIINLSNYVYKTMVVDAPLPPIVSELVVRVGFGGVLRRDHELRDAPR